jgi:hypothetical protein
MVVEMNCRFKVKLKGEFSRKNENPLKASPLGINNLPWKMHFYPHGLVLGLMSS